MWALRALSSIVFLFSIVFSIPLAFDVGGRTCGLAFSLSLSTFYFFLSVLRLFTPTERSRFRAALATILGLSQWIVLPALLIWSLNRFSVDSDASAWVERTFGEKAVVRENTREWLFGSEGVVETATIGTWGKLLRWSTPVFQLCEGFCSLLVIQATGQISRWLVNRGRSDTWMVCARHPSHAVPTDPHRSAYSSRRARSSRAPCISCGGSLDSPRLATWMRR